MFDLIPDIANLLFIETSANLLIIRTDIKFRISFKFGHIVQFTQELLPYSILFYPIILESCNIARSMVYRDDFAAITFKIVLFSAALVELAKSIYVHSLILSSQLFFCLSLLFPFNVICRIVFTKPEDQG